MKRLWIAVMVCTAMSGLADAQGPDLGAPLPGGPGNPFVQAGPAGGVNNLPVPSGAGSGRSGRPADAFPENLDIGYVVGGEAMIYQVLTAGAGQPVAQPQPGMAPGRSWTLQQGGRVTINGERYVAEVTPFVVRLYTDTAPARATPKKGALVWTGSVGVPTAIVATTAAAHTASSTATLNNVGSAPVVISGKAAGGASSTAPGSGATK